jgi:dTDP-4-amino-4,6-dideoxygalactose transaminase
MSDLDTVTSKFLPFALPDIGEEEIAEVVDSLRSGWITTGPKAKKFEQQFAEFIGSGVEAIAVNSATAGLHLALEAAGVREGDEVITTPYTFTATAEVIRYLGAHPVFVDVDPLTLNINPDLIEAAVTARTRAIIPVHFAGLPADMNPIMELASQHGLRVIEDAAHSFPVAYDGTLVGALPTDATVFSFYATKTITTGEGGMIVSRDADLLARCRIMRLHGISRDAFDRYTSETPSWYYEVIEPGFKYNMTDVAAALGIHQLRKAYSFLEKRHEIAARYDQAFADLPIELPYRGTGIADHAFHLYVIRLQSGAPVSRDAFIAAMAAKGIGCSVHFIPLHIQPYWRDQYHLRRDAFPAALQAFEAAVSLPIYTRMSDADQERVIAAVRDILM